MTPILLRTPHGTTWATIMSVRIAPFDATGSHLVVDVGGVAVALRCPVGAATYAGSHHGLRYRIRKRDLERAAQPRLATRGR